MLADLLAELVPITLIECRDPYFQQFVMFERNVDFVVQVVAQAFLADRDNRLQLESVTLGAQAFDLLAGQLHD